MGVGLVGAGQVAVLFARRDSVYKGMAGCDVWDADRDARRWPGGAPIVAHPPCAQWGRLRRFARDDPESKALGPLAVRLVREHGGVLEHPFSFTLWAECGLLDPGQRDQYGGFTLPVNQCWFGHRARKPTLLYIVGVKAREVPAWSLSFELPAGKVEGTRGSVSAMRAITKREREATPEAFARWLLEIARAVA